MSMTLLTCSFCTGHCSWQDQQVVQAQSSSSPMTSPIMLGASATSASGRRPRPLPPPRRRRAGRRAAKPGADLVEVVLELGHQQLGRERLAGQPRGAVVLAAPALGARVQVQELPPREAVDAAHAVLLEVLVLQVERPDLRAARLEVAEELVHRAHDQVQVLAQRDVDEEGEQQHEVHPPEDLHAGLRGAVVERAEQRRERAGDRGERVLVARVERVGEAAVHQCGGDQAEDQREDDGRLQAGLQPRRPHHVAVHHGDDDGDQHEDHEHVEHEVERPSRRRWPAARTPPTGPRR